jgi:N-acetylglucosaminyldiphosphoundecaprenol N-acetyl-beta-D-mannosaminyltransferase
MTFAARRGWRVYLLGGGPGAAERAADHLKRDLPGLQIVGVDAPEIDIDKEPFFSEDVVTRINAAKPDIILVAFGCPKQEIFIHRIADAVRPAVAIGVGASFDFEAGAIHRAPHWISTIGLEWLYRLAREPTRLWRRYLARDPQFFSILYRSVREHGREQIQAK